MKLYNTLTRQVEEFVPRNDKQVKLFVCGPTVYDDTHLGHAKTYVQMDTLARVLDALGFDVFYLQNITDLDDKVIARAQEKNIDWQELRNTYESRYFADMKRLNNSSISQYARATDHINDIIKQVKVLLAKEYAYIIDDGVYFEVSKFKGYGKLSGRTEVQEEDAQSRIDQSAKKRGWNDFCLWKFSKPGEPVWDAPFGKGRPGWHIEDTAITEHYFGPQYDIHGGAVDLIFPHHEAEITQMEAASGKVPFVKYWVHTGFLVIDDTKMSKSKGNFFTLRQILKEGYDPMAIRLLMLQSHYRSQLNFSWQSLEAATDRLQDIYAWADLRHQPSTDQMPDELDELFRDTKQAILEALHNDLNTALAMTHLGTLMNYMQNIPIPGMEGKYTEGMLKFLDSLFGLNLADRPDISDDQKKLLANRQKARETQDWDQADALREQLETHGLGIRDTSYGQQWYRLKSLPKPAGL